MNAPPAFPHCRATANPQSTPAFPETGVPQTSAGFANRGILPEPCGKAAFLRLFCGKPMAFPAFPTRRQHGKQQAEPFRLSSCPLPDSAGPAQGCRQPDASLFLLPAGHTEGTPSPAGCLRKRNRRRHPKTHPAPSRPFILPFRPSPVPPVSCPETASSPPPAISPETASGPS